MSSLSPTSRLVIARGISKAGSGAAIVGLNSYLLAVTHSSTWVAAGVFATAGAAVVAAPVAGIISDHFDRKRVMIYSDLVAMTLYLLMALAIRDPLQLVIGTLLATIAEEPFFPASVASLPSLVRSPEELARAGGSVGSSLNLGNAIGPIAGGSAFVLFGVAGLFILNAISFALSAWLVFGIRRPFREPRPAQEARGKVLQGLKTCREIKPLALNQASKCVSGLVNGAYWVAIPLLAAGSGLGALAYGILLGVWGGGLSIGSLVAGHRYTRSRLPSTLLRSRVAMGCGVVIAGISATVLTNRLAWFAVAVTALLAGAVGGGFVEVGDQLIIQWVVPDRLRAQVTAAFEAPSRALFAVSVAASALLLHWISPAGIFTLSGIVILASGIPLLRLSRHWSG